MDTGVSTIPVPIRLRVVANRFVADMSDGTVVEDFGAFPALQDGAPIESVVAANRDAIEALLTDDMTDDEREAALAALVASIHAVVDADHLRVGAIEARLSANEAVLAAHALALTNLGAASSANAVAIAAAQSAIGLLQAAVTALQAATGNNAAAIAAAQAAITALQAKVLSQDGRLDSIAAIVASLSAAQTADEALAAAQGADIAILRGQRTTDAAAISAIQTAMTALQGRGTAADAAIAALQGLRTTDAAAIAANGVAIGALQAAQTADEGTLAAQGASIGALQARALVDENLIAANGLSIASNTTRLAALEAGAPRVYGPPRPIVPYVDVAVVVAFYAVVRAAQGRTYAFSLVNPSVANALAISADGMLSTVADGFAGVAGGSTITVTVRATDNLGGTSDLAVIVEKAALTGAPVRVLLGAERLSTNGTWDKASREVTYPGFTEALFACIGGGASGWQGNSAFGSGGYGGAPGTVAQRLVAKADIPTTFTYTLGAGGAALSASITSRTICNAGGTTTANLVPALRAIGGRGGSVNAGNSPVATSPVSSTPPVTPPSNQLAVTSNRAVGDSYPSFGPGPGGSGASGPGNSAVPYAGGNGGDGGYDQGANACAGGIATTTTFQPAGAGSSTPGRYGGGGAGGMGADSSTTPSSNGWHHAGAGGFPGGGGGGGGVVAYGGNQSSNSGGGGAGAIDVFYYKWVLA